MIDLGPEVRRRGGRIIAAGTPEQVAQTPGSYTGDYLTRVNSVTTEFLERTNPNNLQRIGIVNKIVGQALASGGVGSPEKRPVLEVRDAA